MIGSDSQEKSSRRANARRANETLDTSRFDDQTLHAILASDIGWLWESDREHRLVWLSESVEAITGLSRDELISRSNHEIFAVFSKDNENHESCLADIDAGRPFAHLLCELKNAKADCRWIELSGIPKQDENGEFIGYRGAGRDVTEAFAFRDRFDSAHETRRFDRELTADIFDTLNVGVIVIDDRNKIILCNLEMARIYPAIEPVLTPGGSLEELLGAAYDHGIFMLFSGRMGSEDPPDRESWISQQMAGRALWVGENVTCLDDGRWIQSNNKLLDDGTIIGIRIDVTEKKKREAEALRSQTDAETSRERLKLAIEAINDGFAIWDCNDRLVAFNEAFRNQFSTGHLIKIGRSFSDMLLEFAHSGDVPAAAGREEEWVAEIVNSRQAEIGKEIVFKTHDDRWIMRRDEMTANGDRVGIRTNVTEIKEREYEAEQARRQLALVLESLPAGVMIFDRDDNFVFANKRLREDYPELASVPSDFNLRKLVRIAYDNGRFAKTGDPELDVLHGVDRIRWEEAFLRREYFHPYLEYDRRETDGRWVKAINLRTEDGLFVGVRIDITEQKLREAALEEAEKKAVSADRAKSEFLANMSHEIRTPMNGVLGMAELLAKTELDAKQKTFTDIIVKSGNALLNIINDILDFSKIDAGHLTLDARPFVLADAINDVVTLVSTRAKEKDLELAVRIQPDLPEAVIGDIGRIRQVVINLVGNAVKFTDFGHVHVDVSGEASGEKVDLHFEFRDSGIGIPASKIDTIFDKFAQGDTSSTRRHEGTGLGLAITTRLIEMMGGKLAVDSQEGMGSKFWFDICLPVAEAMRTNKATPEALKGARVLVIDDNATNRSILLEQLQSWSLDCCAAETGTEGLKVLETAGEIGLPVQCVILEYQMPEMNGAEIVHAIRDLEACRDIPIILLTSVDQSLTYATMRALNIDAHLLKPVRAAHLLDLLTSLIDPADGNLADEGALSFDANAEGPAGDEIVAEEAFTAMPESIRQAEAAADTPASAGRLDILVAEDNEVNQMVFSQILKDTGLEFEIAGNGRLVVEAWRDRSPRMVFMDVSMPEMNGFEATKAIRKAEAEQGLERMPIVGVTAYALKGDRERCFDAGMDDYMSKPVSPHALIDKISEWLKPERSVAHKA